MNVQALKGEYRKAYRYLYDGGDENPEYPKLVEMGDSLIANNPETVEKLNHACMDVISSDREAAAFYLAMKKLGFAA